MSASTTQPDSELESGDACQTGEGDSRAIITVLGQDRPGIVAAVATTLAERGANILDISQTILQGIFSMTMLVSLGPADFSELKSALSTLEGDLGVQITLQREEVFKYMYRL